ncbi:MAG TPA: sodium-translocating pyrophosphatase [Chthoniobacteraceae bacterium]|jgi:K(+)-stimulated pyrophosphate-energized sodium pump|nr:sodium-translocating pyrophosphatase [Chthoniobacteraceae bacterium]
MALDEFLLHHGIVMSLCSAVVGLLSAGLLIRGILAASPGNERMRQIAAAIEEGAKAYLKRQVITISGIAAVIFILLLVFKDHLLRDGAASLGFLVGAICSLAAGFIGMRIAVLANTRTAQAATKDAHSALKAAFNGGAVTGLLVVGLALLAVGVFYIVASRIIGEHLAVKSLVGLALGSSLISVFARLGGGIYTKAADVGADLVGKIESNLDEDDPRNPATIADNVGDNVGDCAGMAADVFETYAVSLIGAVLLGSLTMHGSKAAVVFPFVLGGISVISAIVGIFYVNIRYGKPGAVLMEAVAASGLVSAVLFWPATLLLFPSVPVFGPGLVTKAHPPEHLYFAALVGLVMTGVVVMITNYYTSTSFAPVRRIAKASETGHATNIIAGLAVGQHATALPVGFIGIAILLSFHFGGLYGIAVAVMAMLSMAGIIISLDAFGPITDNAGGIAVMSNLPKEVRAITDDLDAVGNTMKAVTKGYAIASAGLAALVLFGSYVEELRSHWTAAAGPFKIEFSLQDPKVVIGLFIGGLLPFIFTAFSMDAVGQAAGSVVEEVRRQLKLKPGILEGTDMPDYGACVDIVTRAALRKMIVPALLPVAVVVLVAWIPFFGPIVLGGVLVGTIVTGLFVAIAMTSGGGAWDNAKKYIEEGHHGGKHSPAHQAAVTGDTVGDPYKDTAGPAINPMIKVVNILAILIIPIFLKLWLAHH